MKHKKVLLIVFFLTLFVFQQVQAGATRPCFCLSFSAKRRIFTLMVRLFAWLKVTIPACDNAHP